MQYRSPTRKDASLIFLQRCQVFFYFAIVDTQELVGSGCHVNQVRLALSSFLVYEAELSAVSSDEATQPA